MKILLSILVLSAAAFAQCSEGRTYLQSQAYWEQSPGKSGTDFGFVSESTCFPIGATLTGKVHFDVTVSMYDNPGTLTTALIYIFGKSGGVIVARAPSSQVNKKCIGPLVCRFDFAFEADTTLFHYDGLQEFRFHARVKEPDGKELLATTGWQSVLKNGKPVSNYRPQGPNFLEARGWYTGEGYTVGRITSPIPKVPISGMWNPSVAVVKGSGGRAVGSHVIAVDACADCEPELAGTIINSGSGEFRGTVNIDTTQFANGAHTLLIKSSAPSPVGSTLSGAEVVPFYVQN